MLHHRIPRLAATAAGLAALALAVTLPPAAAQADNNADISITGGNGSSQIVCGNVAQAVSEAEKKKWSLQLNNCKAGANGGVAALSNVEIFISQKSAQANNSVLSALARASRIHGFDADKCENHRKTGSKQTTKCWATTNGGEIILKNVTVIKDGVAQTFQHAAVPKGVEGGAEAECWNVDDAGVDQRDDCATTAQGASWFVNDVTVKGYPGGDRNGVNVSLRGGDARNHIACFNVTDGTGKVRQVNICSAEGRGGNVSLTNVKIHIDG